MRIRIAALIAASILAGVLALVGTGSASAAGETTNPCPGDINGDGGIDMTDVQAVIHAFDTQGTEADLNQDGIVDYQDLQIVWDNLGAIVGPGTCLPADGPAEGRGAPSEEWLVAVLDGNASQTAKDAVAANH